MKLLSVTGIKIGCIARLSEQKGLPYLIQAMSLVTNPSVSLFLVGDGELKNDLINQTKKLGLEERIHFLGYRSDVVECINSFDFCVLPSVFEGFGLVANRGFYERQNDDCNRYSRCERSGEFWQWDPRPS